MIFARARDVLVILLFLGCFVTDTKASRGWTHKADKLEIGEIQKRKPRAQSFGLPMILKCLDRYKAARFERSL